MSISMKDPIPFKIAPDHLTIQTDTLSEDEIDSILALIKNHNLFQSSKPQIKNSFIVFGNQADLFLFLYDFCFHYDVLLV